MTVHATFRDTYAGNVDMELVSFRTQRHGVRVIRWRWQATGGKCVTSGFAASGFSSEESAVAAAKRHALFSAVA